MHIKRCTKLQNFLWQFFLGIFSSNRFSSLYIFVYNIEKCYLDWKYHCLFWKRMREWKNERKKNKQNAICIINIRQCLSKSLCILLPIIFRQNNSSGRELNKIFLSWEMQFSRMECPFVSRSKVYFSFQFFFFFRFIFFRCNLFTSFFDYAFDYYSASSCIKLERTTFRYAWCHRKNSVYICCVIKRTAFYANNERSHSSFSYSACVGWFGRWLYGVICGPKKKITKREKYRICQQVHAS